MAVQQNGTHRTVSTALLVVADLDIELLLSELVTFVGHTPIHDVPADAAGESIRRTRPDLVLVDTALGKEIVGVCLKAADEVGGRTLLVSSIATESELASEAVALDRPHFALPGGPVALGQAIERACAAPPHVA